MTKRTRETVYAKYNGHCGYCGNVIEYKNMQVDHIYPKCLQNFSVNAPNLDHIDNLMPSCRRCNHYKRAETVERFRKMMMTLHERLAEQYTTKVAINYGIVVLKPFDGIFYFERMHP